MSKFDQALDAGEGILRLRPSFVPRTFVDSGQRLRVHPSDLYAFGAHRGGICERWIASTTRADNGPDTSENEGLSQIEHDGESAGLLVDAISDMGAKLLGDAVQADQGAFNVLGKLFDCAGPIPHHVHHTAEKAALVGQEHKSEAYFFPSQFNAISQKFPYTWFGLEPGTTKGDMKDCLARWNEGDNGILRHSRAYAIAPDEGWQVDPGILHGPGSLVTYEPQHNSDVFSMWQSLTDGKLIPWELVVKDVPEEYKHDLDFIVELLDWEKNIDPNFAATNRRDPKPITGADEAQDLGYSERWVTYGSPDFSAKELTVLPGRSVTVTDTAPYGVLVIQGQGRFGAHAAEAAYNIRVGRPTTDEFFVSHTAAASGVRIENTGTNEPLVMLKHFGPGHADAAGFLS